MIKQFVASLVLLFTILGSPSATAATFTAQEMIGFCKAPANDPYAYYCLGEASGVMMAMQANKKVPGAFRICAQGVVSNGQAIQIFLNWAARNPVEWQIPSGLGFVFALQEAYPCQ